MKNSELIDLLNAALATSIDLGLAAKQAHWNVKGPQFFSLHQLFDQVYEQASGWVDELAERAVQLGGVAQGTVGAVASRTRLRPYPTNSTTGDDHITAISERLTIFADQTRAAIRAAAELGDDVTSDLFNEVTAGADKQRWMVHAHHQA